VSTASNIPGLESSLRSISPEQLRAALANFIPESASTTEKISVVETALRGPMGQSLRDTMARWIVEQIVPVERLVPEAYLKWRPPVRDSMMFVVSRLSPARLAPKLVEQLQLPQKTSAEERLLRLIAKVPGLQKLGQVIARNRHLRPALRNALARLENGIRDVKPEEIRAIIDDQLRPRLKKYGVNIAPVILSEASVSAVIRFTWLDPESGERRRGVFKVLKPHIPVYFAEDINQRLQRARRSMTTRQVCVRPPPEVPMSIPAIMSLHSESQRIAFKAAVVDRNAAGKYCVGMRRA
jgi:hypothetical protein